MEVSVNQMIYALLLINLLLVTIFVTNLEAVLCIFNLNRILKILNLSNRNTVIILSKVLFLRIKNPLQIGIFLKISQNNIPKNHENILQFINYQFINFLYFP